MKSKISQRADSPIGRYRKQTSDDELKQLILQNHSNLITGRFGASCVKQNYELIYHTPWLSQKHHRVQLLYFNVPSSRALIRADGVILDVPCNLLSNTNFETKTAENFLTRKAAHVQKHHVALAAAFMEPFKTKEDDGLEFDAFDDYESDVSEESVKQFSAEFLSKVERELAAEIACHHAAADFRTSQKSQLFCGFKEFDFIENGVFDYNQPYEISEVEAANLCQMFSAPLDMDLSTTTQCRSFRSPQLVKNLTRLADNLTLNTLFVREIRPIILQSCGYIDELCHDPEDTFLREMIIGKIIELLVNGVTSLQQSNMALLTHKGDLRYNNYITYNINYRPLMMLVSKFQNELNQKLEYLDFSAIFTTIQLQVIPLLIFVLSMLYFLKYLVKEVFEQKNEPQLPDVQKIFLTIARSFSGKLYDSYKNIPKQYANMITSVYQKTKLVDQTDFMSPDFPLDIRMSIEGQEYEDQILSFDGDNVIESIPLADFLSAKQREVEFIRQLASVVQVAYHDQLQIDDQLVISSKLIMFDSFITNLQEEKRQNVELLDFSYVVSDEQEKAILQEQLLENQLRQQKLQCNFDLKLIYQEVKIIFSSSIFSSLNEVPYLVIDQIEKVQYPFISDVYSHLLLQLKDYLSLRVIKKHIFDWQIADKGFIALNKLTKSVLPLSRELSQMEDLEQLFLVRILRTPDIFNLINLTDISKLCEQFLLGLIKINNIPDFIYVDCFKINFAQIKTNFNQTVASIASSFTQLIQDGINKLLQSVEIQNNQYVRQVRDFSGRPEKFAFLLNIRQQINAGTIIPKVILIYQQLIDFWVQSIEAIPFLHQHDENTVIFVDNYLSNIDHLTPEMINNPLRFHNSYIQATFSIIEQLFSSVKTCQKATCDIDEKIKYYSVNTLILENWLSDHCYKLADRVKEYASIDYDSILMCERRALEFQTIFQLSCKNFTFDNFDFGKDISAFEFFKSVQRYISLPVKLQYFAKQQITLKLETSKDLAILNETSKFISNLKMYERHKISFKLNYIDIKQVINELKYVCRELMILQRTIQLWKKELFKITKFANLKAYKSQNYPSPSSLMNCIVPFHSILVCFNDFIIGMRYSMKGFINNFSDLHLLAMFNQLTSSIKVVRERSEISFKIFTNKMDLIKIGRFLDDAPEIDQQYIDQLDLLSFSITYSSWIAYSKQCEETIMKFLTPLTIFHIMNQDTIKDYHISYFNQFAEMDVPVNKNYSCQLFMQKFINNQNIFDFLLAQLYFSRVDYQALISIKNIQKLLFSFTIETTYRLSTRHAEPGQDFSGWNQAADHVIITPGNYNDFCNNAVQQLALITNNLGYIGSNYLDFVDTTFDQTLQAIAQYSELLNANTLSGRFQQFKEIVQQQKYPKYIELYARDIEALLNQSQIMFQSINRVSYLVYDLLVVIEGGDVIFFSGGQLGDNINCPSFKVSLLNQSEMKIIQACVNSWMDICKYTFNKPTALYKAALNLDIQKQITNIISQLSSIHIQLFNHRYQSILVQQTSIYNKQKNIKESTYKLQIQYNTSTKEISQTYKELVPFYNGHNIPQALMFPLNFALFFGEFPNDRNIFRSIPVLSNEIFSNLTDFIIGQKDGKNVIRGVISGEDELSFEDDAICPSLDYQVMDMCKSHIRKAFISSCKKASDQFQQLYPLYLKASNFEERKQILFQFINENFNYQAIWVGIQTAFRAKYNKYLMYAFMGNVQSDSFDQEISLLQDLPNICLKIDPYYNTAYLSKCAEWIQIWKDFLQLCQKVKGYEVVTSDQTFMIMYYDSYYDNVYSATNMGGFCLEIGFHWVGKPNHFDCLAPFNRLQQSLLTQMMRCLNERLPLVLLGYIEYGYQNQSIYDYISRLSRLSSRRFIFIPIAENTFAQNIQRVSSFVITGYIVVIIGLEFLPSNQLLELVGFVSAIQNRQGIVPGIAICKPTTTEMRQQESFAAHDLSQQMISVQDAIFQDFDDIGNIIFYIPGLYPNEMPTDFFYSQQQIKPDDQSSAKNVVNNYSKNLVCYQHIQKIISVFKHKLILNIEMNNVFDQFRLKSPQFCRAFYEVSTFLFQLNNSQATLRATDIPSILTKSKSKDEPVCVAAMTLDYILHQNTSLLFNDLQEGKFIAQIISASFGLDKDTTKSLILMSEDYCNFVQQSLIRLGIKEQEKINQQIVDESVITFPKYFQDHLTRFASTQYLYYINMFSIIHQYPLQVFYDVLYVNELLKQLHPVLLISPQSSFSRVFQAILAAIKNWQSFYVVNSQGLSQALKQIDTQKDKRDALILIAPSSMSSLTNMMDQIIGLFLTYPVIHDRLKLTSYINDSSKGPYILVFVDINLANQFKDSEYFKLFINKMVLIPSIEGSDGSKKLIIRTINQDNESILQNLKFANNLLRRTLINSDLHGVKLLDNTCSSPLSVIIKNIKSQTKTNPLTSKCLKSLVLKQQGEMRYFETLKDLFIRSENRLYALKFFVHGIIQPFYDQTIQIFNVGRSIEETLLLRSLILLNLERFKIINVKKPQITSKLFQQQLQFFSKMPYAQQRIGFYALQNQDSLGADALTRLKVMMYFFMIQLNAPKPANPPPPKSKEEQEATSKSYYSDMLTTNRMLITEELVPFFDIGGYIAKDIYAFDQYQRGVSSKNSKLNDILAKSTVKNAETPISDIGMGFSGSLYFNLDEDFLVNSFLLPNDVYTSFKNVATPIITSIWNAASLFFAIQNFTNKYLEEENKLIMMQNRYYQFKNYFVGSGQKISTIIQAFINPFCVLAAQQDEIPILNIDCMRQMNTKQSLPLSEMNHNLSNDIIAEIYAKLIQQIDMEFPQQYGQCLYSYINFQHKLSNAVYTAKLLFCEYELGYGLLNNVSQFSNKQQVNETIEQFVNYMFEQFAETTKKGMPVYSCMMKCIQYAQTLITPDTTSIQNTTGSVIYLGPPRAATAFFIAAGMMTPISLAVIGDRSSGKSTLIECAKLICRDLIDHNTFLVNSICSDYSVSSIISTINRHFQLKNYQNAQKQRYDSNFIPQHFVQDAYILDYNKSFAFPCYHFHASDCVDSIIADQLAVLIRDHIVQLDTRQSQNMQLYLDNSEHSVIGITTLSDCAFIVETTPNNILINYCTVTVHVPQINEQFLMKLFEKLYPQSTKEWNNNFIQGFFMVRNSFPSKISNNFTVLQKMKSNQQYLLNNLIQLDNQTLNIIDQYSKKRSLNEQNTTQILKDCTDHLMSVANAHSLFYALRSLGCVSNIHIQQVIERLASLAILGYLSDYREQTAWSDSQIILTGRFTMYPAWEAFLINKSISSEKLVVSDLRHEHIKQSMQEQRLLIPCLYNEIISSLNLPSYLLVGMKYFAINPFWIGHIIETSKSFDQNFDPLILSRSMEIFISLMQTKELNQCRFDTLMKHGIRLNNSRALTGIIQEDPFYLAMVQTIYNVYKFTDNVKLFLAEKGIPKYKNIQTPDYVHYQFAGITLPMVLAMKPSRSYLNLQNASTTTYITVIQNLSSFSGYELYQDYLSKKELKDQSRVLFDIVSLSAHIQSVIQQSNDEFDDKTTTMDLIAGYGKKLLLNPITSASSNLIMIITLLRISVGLSLGINPKVFLQIKGDHTNLLSLYSRIGLHISSLLDTFYPSNSTYGGTNQVQLPLQGEYLQQFEERLASYSDCLCSASISQSQDQSSQLNDLQQYLQSPIDVMLVASKSLLDQVTPKGVSVLNLLTQTLEPLSCLSGIFSDAEVSLLIKLVAINYKIDTNIKQQFLTSLISMRLQFLLVNDDPCGKQIYTSENGLLAQDTETIYSQLKIDPIGAIKSPILEFITSIVNYREVIPVDEYRNKKHKIEAVKITAPQFPLTITDPLIIFLQQKMKTNKFNLINVNLSSMETLYQISGCQSLQSVVFPDIVEIDWKKCQMQFQYGVVQVYSFLAGQAQGPCVTLQQFSIVASSIASLLYNRCNDFFQSINYLFLAYRLYDTIASHFGAKRQNVDINQFNAEFMKKIIQDDMKQYINGKLIQLNDPVKWSLYEASLFRDYLQTIIDMLKADFMNFKYTALAAHADSIMIASYLLFGMNDLITESRSCQILNNGSTNDLQGNFVELIDRVSNYDENICAFNLMAAAQLMTSGFNAIYPLPDVDIQIQQSQNKDMIVLAQNALVQGNYLFFSHLFESVGFDWPIYVTMKMLNIQWQPNDVACTLLTGVCVNAQIGKTLFFVKSDLALAASVLIEAIKGSKIQPRYYYRVTDTVAKENEDMINSPGRALVQDLGKKIVQIDLTQSSYDFDSQLARTLGTEDCTMLFTNFGASDANSTNINTLQKFLELRSKKIVDKRQLVTIGRVTTITNNALHWYTIVIALNPLDHCITSMKNGGILTQQFLDESALCIQYGVDQIEAKNEQKESDRVRITTQQILQACYGDSAGYRAVIEKIRCCIMSCTNSTRVCSDKIFQFVKNRVQMMHLDISSGTEITYEVLNDIVTQKTQTHNFVKTAQLISIFNSTTSDPQKILTEFSALVDEFKRLGTILYGKRSTIKQIEPFVIIGNFIHVACQQERFIRFEATDVCTIIAKATIKVFNIFNELCNYHTPAQSILSIDQISRLKFHLRLQVGGFLKELYAEYAADQDKNLMKQGLLSFKHSFHLSYCIIKERQRFIIFISNAIVHYLNSIMLPLLPQNIQQAMYNYMHIVFLSLTQIIHFSHIEITARAKRNELEVKLLQQLLSFNFQDYIQLVTSKQVQITLQQSSLFAYQIPSNHDIFKYKKRFVSIQEHLPSVCKLAQQIAHTWININLAAKLNESIHQTLNWMIEHQSTLIALCQCYNPFLQIVYYYYHNNVTKNSSFEKSIKQLLESVGSEKYQIVLPELPPSLEQPTDSGMLAALAISISLRPEQITESLIYYSKVMEHAIGMTFQKSISKFVPNSNNMISALITPLNRFITQSESFKLLQLEMVDIVKFVGQITGMLFKEEISEVSGSFISEQLFQLFDLVVQTFKPNLDYQQQYLNYQRKKSEANGKIENLQPIGSSHINIAIIYYDTSIAIDILVQFAYSCASKYTGKHRPIIFSREITIQMMEQYFPILNVDPALDGDQIILGLISVLRQKQTIFKTLIIQPIFLLIPSSNLNSPSLSKMAQTSSMASQSDIFRKFLDSLHQLQLFTNPSYVYVQMPNNMFKQFKHNYCMILATISELQNNQTIDINNLEIINLTSTRGMVIAMLRQSFINLKSLGLGQDSDLVPVVRRVYNSVFSKLRKKKLDLQKEQVGQIAISDMNFINFDTNCLLYSTDNLYLEQLNQYMKQLLFGDNTTFDILIPHTLQVAQQSAVLVNKLDNEEIQKMLQKQVDEESAFQMEKSAFSHQEQSQYLTKQQQKMGKRIQTFITGGGTQYTSNVQFSQSRVAKNETNIYHLLEKQLLMFDVKIKGNVSIDYDQYEDSIRNYFYNQNRQINIITVERPNKLKSFLFNPEQDFCLELPTKMIYFEEFLQFLNQVQCYDDDYLDSIERCHQFQYLGQEYWLRCIFNSNFHSKNFSFLTQHRQQKYVPHQLLNFIHFLPTFSTPVYGRFVKKMDQNDMLEYLLGDQNSMIVPSQSVSGQQCFQQLNKIWVLSANVFAPIAGDIFNYLRLANAGRTMTTLVKQRIVITTRPGVVRINAQGGYQFLEAIDKRQLSLIIRGFELFGASYDYEIDSIVDLTPENRMGYGQLIDLYVQVVHMDSIEYEYGDESKTDRDRLKIPSGFVPVPLKVGGYIHPIVLLKNRTNIPDEEWLHRVVFFSPNCI